MEHSPSNRLVRILQWIWVGGAMLLIGGYISWILHLIRAAWTLSDVPSASIGISLVAIPVFLVFSGVIVYVFWGLTHERR
jgi:hypothetical protein